MLHYAEREWMNKNSTINSYPSRITHIPQDESSSIRDTWCLPCRLNGEANVNPVIIY